MPKRARSIAEIFEEGDGIDRAVRQAVREALRDGPGGTPKQPRGAAGAKAQPSKKKGTMSARRSRG